MSSRLDSCNVTASTGEHHVCEQSANLEASEESWFLLTVAVLHVTLQTWRQEHEGEEDSGSWAGKQKSGVASTVRHGFFLISHLTL